MKQTERVQWVPPAVKSFAQNVYNATGTEMEVDQPDTWFWRLTISNERVLCTVDFKRRAATRKVDWSGSELYVDGQKRKITSGIREFARLFDNPDVDLDAKPEWTPAPTPPPGEMSQAPSAVKQIYRRLCEKLGELGELTEVEEPKLGFTGNEWIVYLITGELDMRFYFDNEGGAHKLRRDKTITLHIFGEDWSHLVKDGIESALALLSDRPGKAPPVVPGPRHEQKAARDVSVQTRRASVYRI